MKKFNNIIPYLSLREDFINRSRVLSNGFSETGSLTINNGVSGFSATDYLITPIDSYSGSITFFTRCTIDSMTDAARMFGSSVAGTSTVRTYGTGNNIYIYLLIDSTARSSAALNISAYLGTGEEFSLCWVLDYDGTNTTIRSYLNGVLGSTSAAFAGRPIFFGDFVLGYWAQTGGSFDGSIKDFQFYKSALEDEDILQLHNDTLTSNLEPHKSTIFLPSNREYTESGGDKVTPAIGTSGVSEVTCGDGTTSSTFPTLGTDRMWSFDGGNYLNAGDDDDFSFTVSNAFTVGCLINRISDTQLHLLGKYTTIAVGGGEWILTSFTGFRPEFIMVDDTLGGSKYWIGATDTLLAGQDYSLIFTYDGSGSFGTTNGILYVNGIDVSSIAGSSGSFTDMRNTTNNLVLGARSNIVGPLPNGTKFGLPFIYPVEFSPLQAKIMHDNMMRWRTI